LRGSQVPIGQVFSEQGQVSSRVQLNTRADLNNIDSFLRVSSPRGDSASHSATNVLSRPRNIRQESQFSPQRQTRISRFSTRLPQRSVIDSRRSNFRAPIRRTSSRRISFGSPTFSRNSQRW
jgi:hypothetical protein